MNPKSSNARPKPKGRPKQSDVPELTADQKIHLASLVATHSHLWRLDHPLHRNRDATATSWEVICSEIGVSVESCKKAWKSLCDGVRNRTKGKVTKSGDSASDGEVEVADEGSVEQQNQSKLESWEFYTCTRFLHEGLPKRKTTSCFSRDPCSSATANNTFTNISRRETGEALLDQVDMEDQAPLPPAELDQLGQEVSQLTPHTSQSKQSNTEPQSKQSNTDPQPSSQTPILKSKYSYTMKDKENRQPDPLATALTEFIDLRKKQVEQNTKNLTYESMYANLDRLLSQLPPSKAEDLNMQFTQMAYNAVQQQQIAESSSNTIYIINNSQD